MATPNRTSLLVAKTLAEIDLDQTLGLEPDDGYTWAEIDRKVSDLEQRIAALRLELGLLDRRTARQVAS